MGSDLIIDILGVRIKKGVSMTPFFILSFRGEQGGLFILMVRACLPCLLQAGSGRGRPSGMGRS
jgi:hypothetical protein